MLAALSPNWTDLPHVQAFTFSREGGVSAGPYASLNLAHHVDDVEADVFANRQAVTTWLPGNPQMQWLTQVHGTEVINLTSGASVSSKPVEADGVIAGVPGIACCVLTADCLPVFLTNAQGDEVALVHAGWRGLAGGIVERAIASMQSSADTLRAWLGPAIGACHFEVGAEVREAFVGDAASTTVATADLADCFQAAGDPDKYMANLYAIAERKLLALGVPAVSGGEHCSYCDRERFYSFRRDGRTGRNLSIIYIQPV